MAFLSNSHRISRNAPASRATLSEMMATYRQRRALARLDAAALEDLGLTREEALAESQRPFWDLPVRWR